MSTSRSVSRRWVRVTSSRPSNSRSTTTTPLAPAPPANSRILLPHEWFERSCRQLQQQPSSDTSTSTSTTTTTPPVPAPDTAPPANLILLTPRQLQQQAPSDTTATTTTPPAPAPPANLILLTPLQPSSQLQQQAPSDTTATTDSKTKSSPFDCNICLSQATEPVVTCCGHLYCWPCLYTWLQRTDTCAVCRGLLNPHYIFPIYGANGDDEGRDGGGLARKSGIPRRPSGLRIDRVE